MSAEPDVLQLALVALVLDRASTDPNQVPATYSRQIVTSECTFTVAFATRVDAPESEFVDVPVTVLPAAPDPHQQLTPTASAKVPLKGTPPLVIRVVATPTLQRAIHSAHGKPAPDGEGSVEIAEVADAPGYFGATGYFVYKGGGVWTRLARTPDQDQAEAGEQFAPPFSLSGQVPQAFSLAFVCFFLARVRDCTKQALEVLQKADRNAPKDWQPDAVDFKSVKSPPIEGGRVAFSTNPLKLDCDSRVLEIKSFAAPALVAACWPRSNGRQNDPQASIATPMEALIFFHASLGQNAPIYNADPYPFGHAYIDHGLQSYLGPSDPLQNAYPLSLPYQIASAGKQAVTILPLNRVRWPELANFNHADQAVELLEEIQMYFLRRAGIYFQSPNVGRLALASFSAGIQEMLRFKTSVVKHRLLSSLVKEIYIFDPVHTNATAVAGYANGLKAWAGKDPDRRVRVYNNQSGPGHVQFLGRQISDSPIVLDSTDGRFTVGIVSDKDWLDANDGFDKVRTLSRSDLFFSLLKQAASRGQDTLQLQSVAHLSVGKFIFVSGGGIAHRVLKISGKTATVTPALLIDVAVDAPVFEFDPIPVATTLAEDVPAGADTVKISDPGFLLEPGDLVLIAGTDVRFVKSIDAVTVALDSPLPGARSKGDALASFKSTAGTVLAQDAPAGSTEVHVLSARGFHAGGLVSFNRTEQKELKRVAGQTITLAKPTDQAFPKGTPMELVEPRKLPWGTYHAMFVATFITDAMRKSGFK